MFHKFGRFKILPLKIKTAASKSIDAPTYCFSEAAPLGFSPEA
jgi:hypothetical protein